MQDRTKWGLFMLLAMGLLLMGAYLAAIALQSGQNSTVIWHFWHV